MLGGILWIALGVLSAPLRVVCFNGHWCGACAAQAPAWQRFARAHTEAVLVDVDQPQSSAYRRYGFLWEKERSMPLTVWVSGDRILEQHAGVLSLTELQRITRHWGHQL